MKVLVPLFALFALASAQGLTIGTPKQGDQVPLDQPFTVQVIKNEHIISSIEVAITIGAIACPTTDGCPDPSAVGTVLYQGPFKPRQHAGTVGFYQNFTVTIPSDMGPVGNALLTVNRFFLIGINNGATLQSFGTQIETVSN